MTGFTDLLPKRFGASGQMKARQKALFKQMFTADAREG
tara:strand:- start:533 stop:646 length:114 start_codon:yes stop_codon:yes gene_type:complete